MRISFGAAAVALGVIATSAHAEWQYAKWNMTQRELIAASRGKAWVVTDSGNAGKYGRRLAEASTTIDGKRFKVAFFGSGGVYHFGAASMNVPYKLSNIRFEPTENCDGLLTFLKETYRVTLETVGGDFRFADGGDEISYSPGYSRCSFRRFKKGRF